MVLLPFKAAPAEEVDVTRQTQTLGCVIAALVCFLAIGCSDRGFPMTEVSGKVLFNGGPPPKAGRISFTLVRGTGEEGVPYRPGSAPFGTDGSFAVTTFDDGDGLMPGTYDVRIICLSGDPSSFKNFADINFVPASWKPEQLVITGEEDAVTVEYDVPAKKSR